MKPYPARLRRVGGSVMLAVPPVLLKMLRLGPDAHVELAVEQGRLVIEPRTRPAYTLDELLAQCDAAAPAEPADREWTSGPRRGKELI